MESQSFMVRHLFRCPPYEGILFHFLFFVKRHNRISPMKILTVKLSNRPLKFPCFYNSICDLKWFLTIFIVKNGNFSRFCKKICIFIIHEIFS